MAHTQAPLFIANDSSPVNLNVVATVGEWYICCNPNVPFGNSWDDALLFHAAPELLMACEVLVSQFADAAESALDDNALDLGRTAISKAKPQEAQ